MNSDFFPDLQFSPQDTEPGDQFSAWLSSTTAPQESPPIPPSLPAHTPSPPSMPSRNGVGTSTRSRGIRRTPRNNPISFAGQSIRGTRDEGDYRARRNRGIINNGRGYASVPTVLLGEPEVPLMDLLPSTLHESGLELGGTSGLIMGPVTAAPIQTQPHPVIPTLPNYVPPGGFGANSMEHQMRKTLFPTSASNSIRIKDEGIMADVGSESSNINANGAAASADPAAGAVEDWEDVTIQPLHLASEGKRFSVPVEWEVRFRNAATWDARYALLNELERLGEKFVEELKRERKEAYYNRMHAKSNLNPRQKVTIRGRIHSKLNPFVKKQTAEAQRVILEFLVRQIPLTDGTALPRGPT